jgi:hypothetical protein
VNHNEDIEDGLEEFKAEKERVAAEREYIQFPRLFDRHAAEPQFVGKKAATIILIGRKTKETGHPFDFENGFVSVYGEAYGLPHILDLHWTDNGATVDTSLRQL